MGFSTASFARQKLPSASRGDVIVPRYRLDGSASATGIAVSGLNLELNFVWN